MSQNPLQARDPYDLEIIRNKVLLFPYKYSVL